MQNHTSTQTSAQSPVVAHQPETPEAALLRYAASGLNVIPTTMTRPDPSSGRAAEPKAAALRGSPRDVATKDPDVIRGWIEGCGGLLGPLIGLGISRLGDAGVLVLDIDVKNGQPGIESAARLGVFAPDWGGAGYVEQSPSGGLHLWWRLPEGFESARYARRAKEFPGLELFPSGNDANFLVVAPTPGYRALRGDLALRGAWPEPPKALLDAFRRPDSHAGLCRPPSAPVGFGGALAAVRANSDDATTRRRLGWIRAKLDAKCAEIASTPSGGRRDALNRAAFDIFGCIAGAGADERALDSVAQQALFCAGMASGLAEWRVQDTIDDARRDGFAKPRTITLPPDGTTSSVVIDLPLTPSEPIDGKGEGLK